MKWRVSTNSCTEPEDMCVNTVQEDGKALCNVGRKLSYYYIAKKKKSLDYIDTKPSQ